MKYRGRATISIIVSWFLFSSFITKWQEYGTFSLFEIGKGIIFFLIAYWAGKKYDIAKFYSEKDELTALYNRRYLMHHWNKKRKLYHPSFDKLFVVFIDCDNFKYINDTYGHEAGDQVLKNISMILKEKSCPTYTVCRWGGDEFVIVGKCKDENTIHSMIQQLTDCIEQYSKKENIPVSLSVGVSFNSCTPAKIEQLIALADHNMYKEKSKKKVSCVSL